MATTTTPIEYEADPGPVEIPWCKYDVVGVADGEEEKLDKLVIDRWNEK